MFLENAFGSAGLGNDGRIVADRERQETDRRPLDSGRQKREACGASWRVLDRLFATFLPSRRYRQSIGTIGPDDFLPGFLTKRIRQRQL